ncbi:MAG: hypothetical protein IJZ29_02490 [Clostridia bacterium]|nr:hypothetical protein [Clostridia bacterium]
MDLKLENYQHLFDCYENEIDKLSINFASNVGAFMEVTNLRGQFMESINRNYGELNSNDFNFAKGLKHLTINCQPTLFELDLSEVKGLESLEIFGNKNLSKLKLPNDFKSLKSLTICGNNQQTDFDAKFYADLIKDVIESKGSLERITINQSLYFDIVKNLESELNDNKFKFLFDNIVRWRDNIGSYAFTEITTQEMEDYDLLLEQFIKSAKISKNDDYYNKLTKLYAKFITTMGYDHDYFILLDDENSMLYKNYNKFFDNLIEGRISNVELRAFGKQFKTNNAFGVFERKQAVCEGLAKGYEMLCKKCGLDVSTAYTIADNGELHAINKVKIDGNSFYFDPTYDIASYGIHKIKKNCTVVSVDAYAMNKVVCNFDDSEGEEFVPNEEQRQRLAESWKVQIKRYLFLKKLKDKEYIKETINNSVSTLKNDVNQSLNNWREFIDCIYPKNKVAEIGKKFKKAQNELISLLKIKKQSNADLIYQSEIILSEEVRQSTKKQIKEK